jgi:hypothetical protein
MSSSLKAANRKNLKIKSLTFPKNQINQDYLSVLDELDIKCYRGNEEGWIYKAVKDEDQSIFRRAFRFLDNYINISGYNTYDIDEISRKKPFNIPSSRFLRPFLNKLSFFEKLRLRRIKKAMTYAAKNKTIFHLWWHPYNFGVNTSQNIAFLRKIMAHYKYLEKEYDMKSLNMGEISALIEEDS